MTLDDWLRYRERDGEVSPLHRTAIRVLGSEESFQHERDLGQRGLLGRYCGCLGVATIRHKRHYSSKGVAPADEARHLRKWLYECGIPFRTTVRVFDYFGPAVETTWKILIRYWPVFLTYYEGYLGVVVTDRTYQWALSYCQEASALEFASQRPLAPVCRKPDE